MDMVNALEEALNNLEPVISGVKSDHLGGSTPCPDWDVKTVVNHIIGGEMMFAMALDGQSIETEDGPDFTMGDIVTSYNDAKKQVLDAWREPGSMDKTLNLPFGAIPAHGALGVNLTETIVHGWDLAQGTGQTLKINDEVAAALLQGLKMSGQLDPLRGTIVGQPVSIPEDAPASKQLIAFYGRQP